MKCIYLCCVVIGLLRAMELQAATVIWSGASGTDTNWSDAANWSGSAAPDASDDVKFFDAGATTFSNINNVVDANLTIGSLQYANTNNSHTTLIANGVTLTVTNTGGLIAATPTDIGSAKLVTNTVTGTGGTLNVTNASAVLSVNQGGASGSSREILNLSGLSTFTANINRIGIGTTTSFNPGNANNKVAGVLYLAQTNVIVLNLTDTLANYQTAGNRTNSIEISKNPGNNGGISSYLYLGQANTLFLDSIGIGRDKNNGSSTWGWMGFNPAYTNNNPVAYFRGVSGGSSRVTWWAVGDGAGSGSSSNGGVGTNDFNNGTIDALINVLSIGRDATAVDTWAGPHRGYLTFNSGLIDVNSAIIGNQSLETGASTTACLGILNVGSAAVFRANTGITLGFTSLATAAGTGTSGNLNVNGGTVYANNIAVGASSSNNIALAGATLIVTNTLATNALGLAKLALTNSVVGLSVPPDGSLRGLTKTLITGGAKNFIQLDSNPVFFLSYPQQFPLIRYTTWTGTNNFGLTNPPTWATGATLVSNGPNGSLDLLLPADPRPIFTAQPLPYSGIPGDNVTTSFTVSIAATSVTPLGYQWYYISGGSTNQLSDGAGPSGSSTLSGVTTTNLQIANAQTNDSGNYFVVVTNVYGTNSSSQALLTISTNPIAPAITGPATATATNGISMIIADAVSGSPVPVLYWQFNGSPLSDGTGPSGSSTVSGAGSATLTVGNPQYPGDQGTYSLIASNSAGWATNSTVVTVLVPPTISAQPTNVVVTNTQSASISVTATGVPLPTYQWYKNTLANPISSLLNASATNATLTIASTSPSDTAIYIVVVQNAAGSVTSSNALLTVNSTMSTTALSPTNGATGICYDTPLYLTFNQTPVLRNAGKIRIYNATNSVTPAETIDLGLNAGNGTQARSNYPGDGTPFNYFPVVITGTRAAIYLHSASGLLTSNQTYYVTIDDGVFADTTGAYFVGIAATNAWQFTTKVGGPVDPVNPVVNADGSADFVTVQGAVDSLALNANGARRTVWIKNGIYFELVNISGKTNVTLLGQNRDATIIRYLNNVNTSANSGAVAGRMSFKINANDVALDNLTLTNTTPQGGGQAEALNTGGSHTIVNNSVIASRQDTLLPGQVFFYNSKIIGNFDYIWGGGNLFFYKCVFHSLTGGQNLTAARTPTSASLSSATPWINPNGTTYSANGFSFVNCLFEADSGLTGITLAGSNGSNGGLDSWAFCRFDVASFITPTTTLSNNYVFWQYQNTDTNGNPATFANVQTIGITNNDPRLLAVTNITTWLNGWTPALLPNIIGQPANQSASFGQPANFSVTATGIPDPTYQWYQNGLPISGATATNYNIASAVRTNGGSYTVVVSNGSGSVTSIVATLTYVDTSPTTSPSTYVRPVGFPLNIVIAGNLATNWADVDGDILALTSGISSTNGASVAYDSTYVHYTNANDVADEVDYTIGDGFGGTAPGLINIVIGPPPTNSVSGAVNNGNGTITLNFLGVPNYLYQIETATDLAPPVTWTSISTNLADGGGVWQFTDAATNYPQRFYRSVYRP